MAAKCRPTSGRDVRARPQLVEPLRPRSRSNSPTHQPGGKAIGRPVAGAIIDGREWSRAGAVSERSRSLGGHRAIGFAWSWPAPTHPRRSFSTASVGTGSITPSWSTARCPRVDRRGCASKPYHRLTWSARCKTVRAPRAKRSCWVVAGRTLGRFNWLDLVPRLASRSRSSAAIAFLATEPDTAVAALIRREAIAALRSSAPLAGLAANSATAKNSLRPHRGSCRRTEAGGLLRSGRRDQRGSRLRWRSFAVCFSS